MRQSTSFARPSATAITAAATIARCQESDMPGLFAPVDRFPPREPLADSMPVRDGLLADVPAELDLLAVADRGEVEQPRVHVLHDHAELVEPLQAGARGFGEAVELGLRRVQVGRGVAASVAADGGDQRRLLAL